MLKQVIILTITVIFLNGPAVYAQSNKVEKSLHEKVIWKGQKGSGFRGWFLDREGDVIRVQKDGTDKIYKININNLHPTTKEWFLKEWEKKVAKKNREPGKELESKLNANAVKLSPGVVIDLNRTPIIDTTGYELVNEEKADRSIVPNFNQADYGSKASDCVPNSYAMFVTWWHLRDWVKVPEKRKFLDTVDWIHKRLARNMRTRNNSGTRYAEIAEYLSSFFSDDVKTKAAFTLQMVEDIRPENLSKYVKGGNCTVLLLSTYYGSKYNGGHAIALKSMDADGTVEFNTWGLALKGKFKAIPGSEKEVRVINLTADGQRKLVKMKLPHYEIELINRADLPEWFTNNEVRFVLESQKQDRLAVVTPYVQVKVDVKEKK